MHNKIKLDSKVLILKCIGVVFDWTLVRLRTCRNFKYWVWQNTVARHIYFVQRTKALLYRAIDLYRLETCYYGELCKSMTHLAQVAIKGTTFLEMTQNAWEWIFVWCVYLSIVWFIVQIMVLYIDYGLHIFTCLPWQRFFHVVYLFFIW